MLPQPTAQTLAAVLSVLMTTAGFTAGAPTFETTVSNGSTFDYIIVGGGTAGTALAARLSLGLKHATILLIEAGPFAPGEDRINIPGMKGSTFGTIYDWNLTSVPQPNLGNRNVGQTRGKVLGGSSALNLMVWDRGSRREYDAWEELGNPGWNWRSMITAMKRAENFTNTGSYGSAGVATGGPVQSVVNRFIPLHQTELWLPTMNGSSTTAGRLDVPVNLESLGGNNIGAMHQPSSIDPAIYNRSYSANAYLPLARPNLHILTSTLVSKVNLRAVPVPNSPISSSSSPSSPQPSYIATGVTLQDGTTVLHAREEVVLSAGTFLSPALLERSGIGQASVLSAAGGGVNIPQKIDLPGVGENLQDHVRVQNTYQLNQALYRGVDVLRHNASYAAEQLALWRAGQYSLYDYTGSGIAFLPWPKVVSSASTAASLLALAEAVAAANTSSVITRKRVALMREPNVAQLELIFSDGYTGLRGYPPTTSPYYGQEFLTLIAGVMHPLSLGSVHIQSSSPTTPPLINPRYHSTEYDVAATVEAAKYARRVALAEPLRKGWTREHEPGLDFVVDGDDAGWREWVRNTTLSIFHPSGTCAMLPRRDGGVVDPRLRVYGVRNLRVVDASVMPLMVSGHIQTAVYGIAERAAEILLADHRLRRRGRRGEGGGVLARDGGVGGEVEVGFEE